MTRDQGWNDSDAWRDHMEAWGAYLRAQRKLANLSLRQLADSAKISNPYLSQLERGMHEPSIRVIRALAEALNVPAEELLDQFGWTRDSPPSTSAGDDDTEAAIRRDPHLTDSQKQALIGVYRSFRGTGDS
jgi:transcriptional regulator with XRE-family HTH domain